MASSKELVIEEILQRIAEEHGVETMALDWSILDNIVENTLDENDE